ncbi:MAG: hypothetical protein WD600_14750, partial [Pseudohongiella sp.]
AAISAGSGGVSLSHGGSRDGSHGGSRDGSRDGAASAVSPLLLLPGIDTTAVRELLVVAVNKPGVPPDWSAVSLRLYRLLVSLRMLGGGFGKLPLDTTEVWSLARWQVLIVSLHACANHCLQQSGARPEDEVSVIALLRRLAGLVDTRDAASVTDMLHKSLMLAARLGIRAQQHWQKLTLDLDAVHQDFAGYSVQHVLAAELNCLPHMAVAATDTQSVPQDVLRDLRLLLKGARILNVQRIESFVLVLSDVYQTILAEPGFADSADLRRALPRAHRRLCGMLDQAAAWQSPGNARRMINTLYECLDRWRGSTGMNKPQVGVNERSPAAENDPWHLCLATNRRLRKLLRRQEDLDSIRVLLLELLRSQEDLIRRQAAYGLTLDSPVTRTGDPL